MPTHTSRSDTFRETTPAATSGISFFTLAQNGRKLTLRISIKNSQRHTEHPFEAVLETGIMRGHHAYIARAKTPSQAIRKCLSLIAGDPIPDPIDTKLMNRLLSNELVTEATRTNTSPTPVEGS